MWCGQTHYIVGGETTTTTTHSKFATLKSPTPHLFILLVKVGCRKCGVLGNEEGRLAGNRKCMLQLKKVEHLGRILYLDLCVMKKLR